MQNPFLSYLKEIQNKFPILQTDKKNIFKKPYVPMQYKNEQKREKNKCI